MLGSKSPDLSVYLIFTMRFLYKEVFSLMNVIVKDGASGVLFIALNALTFGKLLSITDLSGRHP